MHLDARSGCLHMFSKLFPRPKSSSLAIIKWVSALCHFLIHITQEARLRTNIMNTGPAHQPVFNFNNKTSTTIEIQKFLQSSNNPTGHLPFSSPKNPAVSSERPATPELVPIADCVVDGPNSISSKPKTSELWDHPWSIRRILESTRNRTRVEWLPSWVPNCHIKIQHTRRGSSLIYVVPSDEQSTEGSASNTEATRIRALEPTVSVLEKK